MAFVSWTVALLLGALAPALILAGLGQDLRLLPFAVAVTLGHAVILGLPVALFFRVKRWTHIGAALVGGFLVGAGPTALITLPLSFSSYSASVDDIPTVIDGIPTVAGWLQYLNIVGIAGGFGASGALAFWLTLWVLGELADRNGNGASSPKIVRGAALLTISVVATAAVFSIPQLTMDRTCHNMFRDGLTGVSPELSIDLDVGMDQWPKLAKTIGTLARSHRLSLRNSSESRPQAVEVLALSACSENGVLIYAMEMRWASTGYGPMIPGRGVDISVYDPRRTGRWQSLARDLIAALESEWPDKVRFRGRGGALISKPPVVAN